MNFDEKRRCLLKLSLVATSSAMIAPVAMAAARQPVTSVPVALLSLRNASEYSRFRGAIENESRRVFPPSLKLDLIDIPGNIHSNREKLRIALRERPFFACVSESTSATIAAAEILENTPIIFSLTGDPSLSGIVRVGAGALRNVTGFTSFSPTHMKRWEVLFSAFPGIDKVVVLAGSSGIQLAAEAKKMRDSIGRIEVVDIDMKKNVVQQVRAALAQKRIGVDVPHTALTSVTPYAIIDCINESRLPCIYDGTHYVTWGGLMSYEADPLPEANTINEFLLLLLQGIPAAKIPIRYPSSFTLAVNLETAAAAKLELKKSLLLRANVVQKKAVRREGLS